MYSETPDIVAVKSPIAAEPLGADQIATLKQGTLTVLDEVGVHVPSLRAREIFASHGARVGNDDIVRIPPDLVQKAMATAPSSFVLSGREERLDLTLGAGLSYYATEGVGVKTVDPETGVIRPSRKEDVARTARICDALPLLGFYWPLVSAQDYGRTAPLHECHAGLTSTLKHVRGGTTVYGPLAKYVVEMASVVGGGAAELRRRPPICANICTISPLAHDIHGLECALAYAEAGIPQSFMAMTTMGSVAPATVLGAIVQGDAEVVSGMVLVQLAFPGAPVFHSVLVSLMEPHSGGYLSEVEAPVEWIVVQLAHAWGVPSLAGGSVSSDALTPHWLTGSKAGLGAVTAPLFGGDVTAFFGLTGGATILYPEKMILDHDACLRGLRSIGDFAFDPADIAIDVIRDVGPRGHFLAHRHTRQHLRDHTFPFWLTAGGHAAQERGAAETGEGRYGADFEDARAAALAEYRRLERDHHPRPLPDDVLRELDAILAAAEREAERL